jgi:hypothetical protein
MLTKIKSIADVEAFFLHLINKDSLNFHPDEDFRNYVKVETGLPSYTLEEADFRNKLMEACFKVCNRENADIYAIGVEFLFNKLQP